MSHARTTYNNIIRFNRCFCSFCSSKYKNSSGEKELKEFIQTIYNKEIVNNDRKTLKGKELDIYLPDLKLAFEFDGTYWHADSRFYNENYYLPAKNKTAKEIWEYDNEKDKLAKEIGITIIHIKQYDWENDRINQEKMIKLYVTAEEV